MASLQEQLLKAGMVDEKKAKQIAKEKRKQAKLSNKGQGLVNETREQAKKAQAEKADRDRDINRQRQEAKELKAVGAQIKQLIDVNSIDTSGGEVAYQFTDGTRVKKIYVTSLQQKQLSKGQIAIVSLMGGYSLVPSVVADKIQQRNGDVVILLNQTSSDGIDDDDYYADYKIPDDLMW